MRELPQNARRPREYADQPESTVGPGLFEAVARFRWVVVGSAVVAFVAVFGLSLLQTTRYEAESSMLLTDPRTSGVFGDGSSSVSDLSRYIRNQANFAESPAVAARTAILLDGELSIDEIAESITATAARDLDLVTIVAIQPTAEGAARLADTVGEAYEELVVEQVRTSAESALAELTASRDQIQDRVDSLEAAVTADPENGALQAERDAAVAQLVSLNTRIAQADVNLALYGSGVQYREPAEIPETPVSPRPFRNGVAGAVLGLLGATAFAWWRTERFPRAETRHDPAPILGAPLLGEVPDFDLVDVSGPAPVIHEPESAVAEAYRFVASSVDFALHQINGSTVVVTSLGPGDGKTVTSLNLAAAMSGNGSRVLLVDADERARGLTSMGGDPDLEGLTDLATRDGVQLADCLVRWKVGDDRHLVVLPAGSLRPAPPGMFHSDAFGRVMADIREAASTVVVDSPPLLAAAESLDIAAQVDGIVVVVDRGTPLAALREAVERIHMTGRPVLGYVFNRASQGLGRYAPGYGYGRK